MEGRQNEKHKGVRGREGRGVATCGGEARRMERAVEE